MPIGLTKGAYWDRYQKDCLKKISDLQDKEYSSAKQSLEIKITQLKYERRNETDSIKIKALTDIIETLEMFKKRIR